MKLTLTFLFFFISLPFIHAQVLKDAEIPFEVMDRFTLLYPDAKSVEWQYENGMYKADFRNGKSSTQALISSNGKLLMTQTEIKTCALPESSIAYLTENCRDKKIESAVIIEDEQGIITFEAIVDKIDYRFDGTGQLLQNNVAALETRGNKNKTF